jgi:hypothetical protein
MSDDIKAAVETQLLKTLDADGAIADTRVFAKVNTFDHKLLAGAVRSLMAYEMITSEVRLRRPSKDKTSSLYNMNHVFSE